MFRMAMKLISQSIPRSALLSLCEFSSCSVSIVVSPLDRRRLANEHATAKTWKRTLHGISSDLELTLSLFDNNSHTLQTVSISTCDYTSLDGYYDVDHTDGSLFLAIGFMTNLTTTDVCDFLVLSPGSL